MSRKPAVIPTVSFYVGGSGTIGETTLRERHFQVLDKALKNTNHDVNSTKSCWSKCSTVFRSGVTQQSFSEQQKKTLSTFSSVNYSPTHSIAYINWIGERRSRLYHRLEWDRWFLVFLIGIAVGLVAALLKQSIQALGNVQWRIAKAYLKNGEISHGFWFTAGLNCMYVLFGSFLVTFIHPPAVGGGTPEVLAFLNGILVHDTLNLKNLVVKFCANVLAVASGLPAAIQAPIITYGAIIGAGIGQFSSRLLGCTPKVFTRFRNAEDRRHFTTVGVAAGVSAGFNSPIGGLLFAMEDLSSFWSKGLSWQTFFCSVVATTVAQVFNTAFAGFVYKGKFGSFSMNWYEPIQMHVGMLVPAVLLGIVGGLLGALFTNLNTFISRHRRLTYAKIQQPIVQKVLRICEPVIVAALMTAYAVFLPLGFGCQPKQRYYSQSALSNCDFSNNNLTRPFSLDSFNCPLTSSNASHVLYNPMSTLIQGSGMAYLEKLWSRDTYYLFDYDVCLSAFSVYFFATIYTSGTAIAGGIFVPLLVSGSLYGRAAGVGMTYLWTAVRGRPPSEWRCLDPGVTAAIGAASLLAGVNRLAVASTVIVVEMVGDIAIVIPVLVTIFISKMVADQLSKPLYKHMLDSKALPFLEQNPQVVVKGKLLNMEMSRARDVMSSPVQTIHCQEIVTHLASILLHTNHSAFPVVQYDDETKSELAYGLITRTELYVILCSKDVYDREQPGIITPRIPTEDLSVDYISNRAAAEERIRTYAKFNNIYSAIYVDLDAYIDMSMPKIDQDYSLYRTYLLFRTLGLRHLVVIDTHNCIVGIITRKDLMQFNMEDKLGKLLERPTVLNDDQVITPPPTSTTHHVLSSSSEEQTLISQPLSPKVDSAVVQNLQSTTAGSQPQSVDHSHVAVANNIAVVSNTSRRNSNNSSCSTNTFTNQAFAASNTNLNDVDNVTQLTPDVTSSTANARLSDHRTENSDVLRM